MILIFTFGGYFVEVKSHFSFDDEDMMIASTFFLKYTPNWSPTSVV